MPYETPHSPSRTTETWALLLIEELVRQGVDHYYAAPGSRSTPLVVAAARNPAATVHIHFDERGTAFQALGFARASGRPAAWITTSGTALANGYPAVVEAHLEQVPMILLTADRPPELRATTANQTIRQVGLFGDHVTWAVDMPVPTPDIDPAYVLTTVDHAVRRSARGPVHVNCMYREPLHPQSTTPPDIPASLQPWYRSGQPYTQLDGHAADSGSVPGQLATALRAHLDAATRPLVVLGRMGVHGAFSYSGPVPVLPDIGSQHRFGSGFITTYDALLRDHDRWASLAPDAVIQVGRPPVSKRLLTFLAESAPDWVVLDDSSERIDPAHRVRHRMNVPAGQALTALQLVLADADRYPWDAPWMQHWHDLDDASNGWMRSALPAFSEQSIVRRAASAGQPLVLGSSNSIRHADTFADGAGPAGMVIANRGASGIDGTVATAAGVAAAVNQRVLVILGDLALLHDLNSLALAAHLTILVVNNDGGGIFSYLPVSRLEDVFEPYFATPHGYTFEWAARQFNLAWHGPKTLQELDSALQEADAADGRGVLIEVRTNRDENLRNQTDLLKELQQVLRDHFPLS